MSRRCWRPAPAVPNFGSTPASGQRERHEPAVVGWRRVFLRSQGLSVVTYPWTNSGWFEMGNEFTKCRAHWWEPLNHCAEGFPKVDTQTWTRTRAHTHTPRGILATNRRPVKRRACDGSSCCALCTAFVASKPYSVLGGPNLVAE